jgi:hypothetical protein
MKSKRNLNGRQLTRNSRVPNHNDLGTPRQHLAAIDLFHADPSRRIDADSAWSRAWRLAVTLRRRHA